MRTRADSNTMYTRSCAAGINNIQYELLCTRCIIYYYDYLWDVHDNDELFQLEYILYAACILYTID